MVVMLMMVKSAVIFFAAGYDIFILKRKRKEAQEDLSFRAVSYSWRYLAWGLNPTPALGVGVGAGGGNRVEAFHN